MAQKQDRPGVIALAALCVLVTLGSCVAGPALNERLVQAASAPTSQTDGHGRVIEAIRLAETGQSAGDPDMLRQAARLMLSTGAMPAKDSDTPDLVLVWLGAADALDGKTSRQNLTRGRTLGPAYRESELAALARNSFREIFFAGRLARISARSRSDQPFQLSISNQDGDTVCQVASLSGVAACEWVPVWTEPHIIEIVNPEPRRTAITLITN
jgi:hypothetical protein